MIVPPPPFDAAACSLLLLLREHAASGTTLSNYHGIVLALFLCRMTARRGAVVQLSMFTLLCGVRSRQPSSRLRLGMDHARRRETVKVRLRDRMSDHLDVS